MKYPTTSRGSHQIKGQGTMDGCRMRMKTDKETEQLETVWTERWLDLS